MSESKDIGNFGVAFRTGFAALQESNDETDTHIKPDASYDLVGRLNVKRIPIGLTPRFDPYLYVEGGFHLKQGFRMNVGEDKPQMEFMPGANLGIGMLFHPPTSKHNVGVKILSETRRNFQQDRMEVDLGITAYVEPFANIYRERLASLRIGIFTMYPVREGDPARYSVGLGAGVRFFLKAHSQPPLTKTRLRRRPSNSP
jgi:hypothetical protein